jgi:hypothetical protein
MLSVTHPVRVIWKETAIRRMERHGAETVTTEMVVFEWLETAEHPHFRDAIALIK